MIKVILSLALLITSFVGAASSADITPYLMQENHPMKWRLDRLFSKSRVIKNLDTLTAAGFERHAPREVTGLVVTKHPSFPGYVFKIYLDSQPYYKNRTEGKLWVMRVQGAEKIRKAIKDRHLKHLFKVPHKWVYQLPKYPKASKKDLAKNSILVEEDMDLYSDYDNENIWKSDVVTTDLLIVLFQLIHDLGLRDCPKPDNIPFSKDGRIAFIDTQTWGERNIDYGRLSPFLSSKNREFWRTITLH